MKKKMQKKNSEKLMVKKKVKNEKLKVKDKK